VLGGNLRVFSPSATLNFSGASPPRAALASAAFGFYHAWAHSKPPAPTLQFFVNMASFHAAPHADFTFQL
jgi:hypothetical protein